MGLFDKYHLDRALENFESGLDRAERRFEKSLRPETRRELSQIQFDLTYRQGVFARSDDNDEAPPFGDMGGWSG